MWSFGRYVIVGDRISASAYAIDAEDDEGSARQLAGILRAVMGDIMGREVTSRAWSLLRKYDGKEAAVFNAAVGAAHASGRTLGEWMLMVARDALAAGPHRARCTLHEGHEGICVALGDDVSTTTVNADRLIRCGDIAAIRAALKASEDGWDEAVAELATLYKWKTRALQAERRLAELQPPVG